MAIERRALVALLLAFIASIVAWANFPPDIPHVRYVSIGRLVLAFFLPITATVIWWLLARLHRSTVRHWPGSHSRPERLGPATVIFLSAFHVTTLIALMGAHLWLARLLGVIVGVFLITTGNELPRLRSSPFWRFGAGQTSGDDHLWKRVQRLGGYIRVLMGIAVCVAALSGMRGFAELIVAAVCLEVAACLGAQMLLSRRKSVVA